MRQATWTRCSSYSFVDSLLFSTSTQAWISTDSFLSFSFSTLLWNAMQVSSQNLSLKRFIRKPIDTLNRWSDLLLRQLGQKSSIDWKIYRRGHRIKILHDHHLLLHWFEWRCHNKAVWCRKYGRAWSEVKEKLFSNLWLHICRRFTEIDFVEKFKFKCETFNGDRRAKWTHRNLFNDGRFSRNAIEIRRSNRWVFETAQIGRIGLYVGESRSKRWNTCRQGTEQTAMHFRPQIVLTKKNDFKGDFVSLLQMLRNKFSENAWLLTATVAATNYLIDSFYDVEKLNKWTLTDCAFYFIFYITDKIAPFRILDYINIKSFDYYSSSDPFIYVHSPLYAPESDPNRLGLTQNGTVWRWLEAGADRAKIILGLPAFGRSFKLANKNDYQLMASANGPGPAGPYSAEEGMLTYLEVKFGFIVWTASQIRNDPYRCRFVRRWKRTHTTSNITKKWRPFRRTGSWNGSDSTMLSQSLRKPTMPGRCVWAVWCSTGLMAMIEAVFVVTPDFPCWKLFEVFIQCQTNQQSRQQLNHPAQ